MQNYYNNPSIHLGKIPLGAFGNYEEILGEFAILKKKSGAISVLKFPGASSKVLLKNLREIFVILTEMLNRITGRVYKGTPEILEKPLMIFWSNCYGSLRRNS